MTILTPEEYLAVERKAEYKSEYYDGVMYAMAGVQRAHNRIAWNVYNEFSTHGSRTDSGCCIQWAGWKTW
jgi:Uma2 family endonuclease